MRKYIAPSKAISDQWTARAYSSHMAKPVARRGTITTTRRRALYKGVDFITTGSVKTSARHGRKEQTPRTFLFALGNPTEGASDSDPGSLLCERSKSVAG